MTTPSALISGASIAGPVVAFWLAEAGWDVTVVERAPRLRTGGYPVDVRGAAVDVLRRMGLYDQILARRHQHVPIAVLSQRGCPIGTMELGKRANDSAVEVSRGALSDVLYRTSRVRARYVFGDSIDSLTQVDSGVEVTFRRGRPQAFDVVIGADGIHSRVRGLAFGDETQFIHHLGPYVAVWDVPHADMVGAGAGVVYAHSGRSVMVERPAAGTSATAFVTFGHPAPGAVNRCDTDEVLRAVRSAFAEDRWRSGEIIDTLPSAEDLYFDTVSQIRMSRWSSGRIALVGDSAFAPAFPSGQATSLAITGAYVLASELARARGPEDAFAAYEDRLRTYVERKQDAALPSQAAGALSQRRHSLASAGAPRPSHQRLLQFMQRPAKAVACDFRLTSNDLRRSSR